MGGLWERAIARFNDRSARIGVLGLGYAGLPLTCCFAEAGFQTYGFDIDAEKVEQLQAGRSYIGHIPPERIGRLVKDGRLRPSTEFSHRLRANPARRGTNARPDLRGQHRQSGCRVPPSRRIGGAGEHHLPRHHGRDITAAV